MVKRTAVVLGIMALLMVGGANLAQAQCGDDFWARFGDVGLYVPAKCPPMTQWTTIIRTWEGKVEAPMMMGGGMMGGGGCGMGLGERPAGLLGGLGTGIASMIGAPLDWLFGGFDGVYSCGTGVFGGSGDGPCGPFYGPLPRALAGVARVAAWPTTRYDELW